MKKFTFNGFFIVTFAGSVVAVIQEKWPLAIWIALLSILIELDQIHDTLKEKNKECK
jgi:hypothetical protein